MPNIVNSCKSLWWRNKTAYDEGSGWISSYTETVSSHLYNLMHLLIKGKVVCVCVAVSHHYGFGLLDAGAMVELAKEWQTVPRQRHCIVSAEFTERWVSVMCVKCQMWTCVARSHKKPLMRWTHLLCKWKRLQWLPVTVLRNLRILHVLGQRVHTVPHILLCSNWSASRPAKLAQSPIGIS